MQAPKAPDPMKTAQAQAGLNRDTAITQYGLGATNQRTPYGNLTYDQIGEWDDGTPRFEATTDFSPEMQGLFNTSVEGQQRFGDIALNQLGAVSDTLSTPFDLDESTGAELANMHRTFLDPEWDARAGNLEATLAARGLSPGGEAYADRTREFGDARSRAYDRMYLDAYGTARDTALTERNQPLTELTSMLSMSQPRQPTFAPTPSPGVAPVDYTGLVQSNYQNELASQNAMMGGLFSIPAAIGGGWARAGFPGMM